MTPSTLHLIPPPQLAAAVVDKERRIIEGLVVPYGEPGRTNLGPLRIRPGAIRLGASVIGTIGHNRELPAARMLEAIDTPQGMRMKFRVAPTPLGDQLLAEASPDVAVREGLSIELSEMEFDPASGDCISGLCEFVAFVPIGAYASARVTTVAAHLHQEGTTVSSPQPPAQHQPAQPAQPLPTQYAQPAQAPAVVQPAQAPAVVQQGQQAPAQAQAGQLAPADLMASMFGAMFQHAVQQHQAQPLLQPVQPEPLQGQPGTAQLQAGVQLGGLPQGSQGAPQAGQQAGRLRRLSELQATLHAGTGNRTELYAALQDITNSDHPVFQQANGPAEELWSGGGYVRRFVPLMAAKELTSYKFQGFRWGVKPEVRPYAGDKAEVFSNKPTTVPVSGEAERIAGAHDIDRKFRDFGDTAFWLAYYGAMAESYAEQSDLIAAEALVAMARDITVDANVPAAYAAVNVAQADILRAVALGGAILEDTPNVRSQATYVLMNTQDWLQLLNFTNLDLPAFLSLLNVKPENFQRTNLVPQGSVVLGVKQAASFYELGGGAPIRVEAVDVGRAGIDAGVYGYVGTLENRPGGIIRVPLVPAAG